MKRIYRFLRFSLQDQLLLLKTFLVLGAIRAGLWLLPFRRLRQLVANFTPREGAPGQADSHAVRKIAWAVKTMSRYVPAATCLTQAMTTHLLLSRIGQPALLRIGVARNQEGKFQAHAWVESQGRVVIGKLADLPRYSVLSPVKKYNL